uniref:Uncharacterized protein n=1 Tax=Ursus americanus TaxID=9643 RepID=A0A452QN12_URSAM
MALARAWKQMSWFYYQYLLVTALYMLEPWERTVFSILPRPRARGPGLGEREPGAIIHILDLKSECKVCSDFLHHLFVVAVL